MANFVTKDSGEREQYNTGAVRDTRVGKGRYDLMPPQPIQRLAGVYERGAEKYGAHNWQKGFPVSRYMDSALRHIYQYIEGERTEDHLAQAAWNLFSAMWTEEKMPELNDMTWAVEGKEELQADLEELGDVEVPVPPPLIGKVEVGPYSKWTQEEMDKADLR